MADCITHAALVTRKGLNRAITQAGRPGYHRAAFLFVSLRA
jgi:hypothetical protein